MSRLRFVFLAAALSLLTAGETFAQSAAAYAIVDNTTGFILESSGGQKKLQVGSLTKIATAMVVIDWAEVQKQDLGTQATVPEAAQALATANGVGFHPGDHCSLRDLLYAALMQSDNQAALTLADHVGRSFGGSGDPVAAFVEQMNALAGKLNMQRTHFVNPHGLDEGERSVPFSTADDMAKLTSYAMERSGFRFYVSQKERKISIASGEGGATTSYLLKNTNELLGVDAIDGVKTGTTRKAGQCVIISAVKAPESRQEGNQTIITPRRIDVVVLGSADRFNVAHSLLEKGWRLYDGWAAAGRPKQWRGASVR